MSRKLKYSEYKQIPIDMRIYIDEKVGINFLSYDFFCFIFSVFFTILCITSLILTKDYIMIIGIIMGAVSAIAQFNELL